MRAEHAQEFTEALGQVLGGAVRLAEWAPEVGIPEALGLSPAEWAERRLAGQVRLSRDERRRVVEANPSMSSRELGDALGVDHSTVLKDKKALAGGNPPEEEPDSALWVRSPGGNPPLGPASDERNDMAVHYSSETDDWATPQVLFDALDAEFGFTLDVCATPENAKCERYFTAADDGLAQQWDGTAWMNPPYGDIIGRWVEKAHESGTNDATVVCLVPARVDTGWFWDHCRHGEVRFLRGRLRFGSAEASAPFPSAVVVFGADYPACVKWWEAPA